MEELLVAALVGVLISWFILDQNDARKAPEQPVAEEGAPGVAPSAPSVQPNDSSG